MLRPCRQFPEGEALCGRAVAKSCECLRRCQEYYSHTDAQGDVRMNGWGPERSWGCFEREGVPPDEQLSVVPEANETSAKCYSSWVKEEAKEVPCSEVLKGDMGTSVPLSNCPDGCNKRGYCMEWDQRGGTKDCRCNRGFRGERCEEEENMCFNSCNGRGKCIDQFCHCEPPYFSIDCSRSKVFPANHTRPSPVDFKIYMYELPTRLAYVLNEFLGFEPEPIYTAHIKFMEQFLGSAVRTEDPSEANLFFIPAFTFSYTGNGGGGTHHLHAVVDYIRQHHPYWDRFGGRDHVVWSTTDRGGCELQGLAENAIKIVHFGMTTTPDRHSPHFPHMGHPSYGCTHPLRDVVATPCDGLPVEDSWLQSTLSMSLDELLAVKKRTLFFAGGVLADAPEYSGNSRQTLAKAVKEWNDPDFQLEEGGVHDYQDRLRASKFCFAPMGWGWGTRLGQAMLAGCVPVIVQEYMIQQYEDVLPYETFSIRLNNADLPHLRDILRDISDDEYRKLLQGVQRHAPAFSWRHDVGGKAFEYTLASLRRRHLNFKALYYGANYFNGTER